MARKKKSIIEIIKEQIPKTINQLKKLNEEHPDIYRLEAFNEFLLLLESQIASTSNKLSKDKLDLAVKFLFEILISKYEPERYEKMDLEYVNKYYFIEFLDFIFEKENWETDKFVDLTTGLGNLILYHIPNQAFEKLSLSTPLLIKLNLSIGLVWATQKTYTVINKLKYMFIKTDFLRRIDFQMIFVKTFYDEELIIAYSKIDNKIISYDVLNESMKRQTELWEHFMDRSNYKLIPNKKYTEEMFEFTTQSKMDGIKDYVAHRKTLKHFGFDETKDESYGKQYRAYLKKRK